MRKAYCIAFPQTARLLDSCDRFFLFFPLFSSSLSFRLPIRSFLYFGRHTSERRGFRHNGTPLARWSSAHVSFASSRARLNRGNRSSLSPSLSLILSFRSSLIVSRLRGGGHRAGSRPRDGPRWSKRAFSISRKKIARATIRNEIRIARDLSTQLAGK